MFEQTILILLDAFHPDQKIESHASYLVIYYGAAEPVLLHLSLEIEIGCY